VMNQVKAQEKTKSDERPEDGPKKH
jgi:hypothetical protein